jgi:hypothetical protein
MPYEVRMRDESPSHCVIKVETQEIVRCYNDHEEAVTHRNALNSAQRTVQRQSNPNNSDEEDRRRRTMRAYTEDFTGQYTPNE